MAAARERIRAMVPDFEGRRAANDAVARSRVRELLEQGDEAGARAEVESVLAQVAGKQR